MSFWSEAGRPGFASLGWLGAGWPWSVAGHAVGAWSIEEPGRAPSGMPFPGVLGMQTPLAWYDSVSVTLGGDGGWRGFHATLGRAVGHGRPTGRGGRASVDLRSGDFLFDDNALSIARSDSAAWLRGEVASGSRGPVEALGAIGRHLWTLGAGWERRRHALEGSYAQRGAAATLAAGEEQAASGESGAVEYRWRGDRLHLALRGERGRDRHESLGELSPSLREASETRAMAVAELPGATARAVRIEWTRAIVARRPPGGDGSAEVFRRGGNALWGAARWEAALGAGLLRLDLGAGRHAPSEVFAWAPSIEYRFRAGPLGARAGIERLVAPVWSDLAPGVAPFVQRTWAGVLELETGDAARRGRATFLVGRTEDRAVFHRLPLEEEWLRLGARPDPTRFDFALLSLAGEWSRGAMRLGGEAIALARDRSSIQPRVDPGIGGRGFVEWRTGAFGGDLGLLLRAEAEGVGGRESEGGIPELCGDPELTPSRMLPGHVSLGATVGGSLAGAVVTVRARNLENRKRPQTWVDCGTFDEALGPGRELRFAVTVRLAN